MFTLQLWQLTENRDEKGRIRRKAVPRFMQSDADNIEQALADAQTLINDEAREGRYMELSCITEEVLHWNSQRHGRIKPTVEVSPTNGGESRGRDWGEMLAQLQQ